MKQPELFHKTIGILVRAYFEGTLEACDCAKCAVGSLIKDNSNHKNTMYTNVWIDKFGQEVLAYWHIFKYKLRSYTEEENQLGLLQIESTGYNLSDFLSIERAFMVGTSLRGGNFSGLMSVCDTLMQIHEATEEEVNEAKGMFVKPLLDAEIELNLV